MARIAGRSFFDDLKLTQLSAHSAGSWNMTKKVLRTFGWVDAPDKDQPMSVHGSFLGFVEDSSLATAEGKVSISPKTAFVDKVRCKVEAALLSNRLGRQDALEVAGMLAHLSV